MKIVNYKDENYSQVINFLKENIKSDDALLDWDQNIRAIEQTFNVNTQDNCLILLNDNDEIIGISLLKDLDGETGSFDVFYVKKEYRNKGYGTLLLIKQELFIGKTFKEIILCGSEKLKTSEFFEKRKFEPYIYETNGSICYRKEYNI